MSIHARQVLERTPRFSLAAAVSVSLIIATLAALAVLAAFGVGLVEW